MERTGFGDAWGRNEVEYVDGVPQEKFEDEINSWLYFLVEDSEKWEVVPKVDHLDDIA